MKIAVIGATGMLGRPVTEELTRAGHEVTVIARNPDKAREMFPGMPIRRADVFDLESLRNALEGQEGAYVNLQIGDEGPDDRHTESGGLRNLVTAAHDAGLRRVSFLSSLVKNYQGMNGFQWWAFEVKENAIDMLRTSGLTYTIFYPSSFMENLTHGQKQGNEILTVGRSRHPMWFIAGEDYGRQVARDFSIDDRKSREWPVQGPEPYDADQAAEVFVRHWTGEPLRVSNSPLWLLKLFGVFSRRHRNASKIIEALNEYPEQFQAEQTWIVLGKPVVTLSDFARRAAGESSS